MNEVAQRLSLRKLEGAVPKGAPNPAMIQRVVSWARAMQVFRNVSAAEIFQIASDCAMARAARGTAKVLPDAAIGREAVE